MMNTDGYAATGVEIKIVDDRNTSRPRRRRLASRAAVNVLWGYPDEPELTARALDNEWAVLQRRPSPHG